MAVTKSKTDPRIVEIPSSKMAVVQGRGAPQDIFARLMPALYGSVYTLRAERKKQGLPVFRVTGLRARYPDAHRVSQDQWTHIIALPVPEDTVSLPQKAADIEVKLETWEYGMVAQILHLGPYNREDASIRRLMTFIEENGYEIAGDHEEEYVTRPEARQQKTIIRYVVRRRYL